MGFIRMYMTQVGMVLNLLTGSISPQYHVVFDYMFSTVAISTDADVEVWIGLSHQLTQGFKSCFNNKII